MKELFRMFWAFFRIGGLTFGGGYAMLPMLQKEVVEKFGWATEEELMDYYAIGQCTPGIIAVNTATFIGYKKRGVPGAIFATAGVVFPSLVIITIIAAFIQNFAHIVYVQQAFAGIRVAVCMLILNAVIKLWKSGVKNIVGICIFAAAFLLTALLGISPIYLVIASALFGIFWGRAAEKKQNRNPKREEDKK
ncbi:MAG: chromate transporter [Provencibacterium sp.]|jgi:chromate transporter|nr:chromate transporter [Provencibacterium sp.]